MRFNSSVHGSGPYGEFHDGLLSLGTPDGAYINAQGKRITFKGVTKATEFSEGLAAAEDKASHKFGYINTKGEFVIRPRFDAYLPPFEGGFARIAKDGKIGYMDHTGEIAIQPQFLDADKFHEGLARVIAEGPCLAHSKPCASLVGPYILPFFDSPQGSAVPKCRYAFIDIIGRVISDGRYDDARNFSEGLAPVQIQNLWGFIDKMGTIVISPKFESADPFSDGLALVSENGQFGFIDHAGAYVIQPQFKYAQGFVDGLAVVGDSKWFGESGSNYWYIDHSGKQAIPERFVLATSFFKGLAHVKPMPKNPKAARSPDANFRGTFAYIDRTGRKVFTYEQ